MSENFKPIETQEELDNIVKDRIRRAQEKVREEYSDYSDLKSKLSTLEEQISEYEKSAGETTSKIGEYESTIGELSGKIKSYEVDSLKTKTVVSMGLPFEIKDRLKGETEDEIKQDAESLMGIIGKPNIRPPLAEPETPPENPTRAAMKQLNKILKTEG